MIIKDWVHEAALRISSLTPSSLSCNHVEFIIKECCPFKQGIVYEPVMEIPAEQLYKDYLILRKAGADVSVILRGMKSKLDLHPEVYAKIAEFEVDRLDLKKIV
jgi:hypothetical protein